MVLDDPVNNRVRREEMNFFDFSFKRLDGTQASLSEYRGQVILAVNVASQCGFTPQYKELQELYSQYKDKGFTVIGFPCDQFGHQEPGNASEIQSFCERNFGVTFPLSEKIEVNGKNAHPIFQYLVKSLPGFLGLKRIKWNFTKFLVARNGEPLARYAPTVKPASLKSVIENALSAP
jgi:glutathione peroxidase